MNNSSPVVLLTTIIACIILCAGCLSSPQPAGPSPVITPGHQVVLPAATEEVTIIPTAPTENIQPEPAGTTQAAPPLPSPVVTVTWIGKTTGRDAMNDPQVVLLRFRKDFLPSDIPDCGMKTFVPRVTTDPAYGLHVRDSKLTTVPDTDMKAFLELHAGRYASDPDILQHIDPNEIGGAACTGTPANPKWNFVEFNATLIPRNARPGEYDIGINIISEKTVIAQIRINRSFEIDKTVFISEYIPLKKDDMEKFDDVGLVFSRRP